MVARPKGAGNASLEDTLFDKTNLTNFSDAVIAIAITLLVLELKLPAIPAGSFDALFLETLLGETAAIVSYVVAFFVIASFWINYHVFMKYVIRVDKVFVALNIVVIFFIAFLPFPTSIMDMYPTEPKAIIFFALSMTCISVFLFLMRGWVLRHRELLDIEDPANIRNQQATSIVRLVFILASIPIAFFSPVIAISMWLLGPVVNSLAPLVLKKKK